MWPSAAPITLTELLWSLLRSALLLLLLIGVLVSLAWLAGCCPARDVVRLQRPTRRPMLPIDATVVEFRTIAPDGSPTTTEALVIWPAADALENEVRRRQHVRDLHAGTWSGPPPVWLYEDEEDDR